jgi:hypothetical protein
MIWRAAAKRISVESSDLESVNIEMTESPRGFVKPVNADFTGSITIVFDADQKVRYRLVNPTLICDEVWMEREFNDFGGGI